MPSLITRQTAIDAVGVVVEQTAVKITVNGQLASVTPGTAGQTSFTARVTLATEGANQILFSAIDAAGNRTDSTRTVIRDTQAPAVTLNSLPDSATVRADSSLLVTGTITDATKVTANVNGHPLAIDSVHHTFSQRITLASGMNFITITATDAAGNATSVVRQITVDNTPPTLTVTGPAEGLITKELVAHVTGTAVGTSAVTVTVNGAPATLGAGGAFTTDVSIAEGTNTVTVVATNAAGLSVTATRQVERDTQAPTLGWTAPVDSVITKENSVAVSGTITDATTTTLTLNGASVSVNATTTAYTSTLALPADGAASITLVATDAAGNVTSATRTVTRDATAPVITVQSPDSGAVTQAATHKFLQSQLHPEGAFGPLVIPFYYGPRLAPFFPPIEGNQEQAPPFFAPPPKGGKNYKDCIALCNSSSDTKQEYCEGPRVTWAWKHQCRSAAFNTGQFSAAEWMNFCAARWIVE